MGIELAGQEFSDGQPANAAEASRAANKTPKWEEIAKQIPGRTNKKVRERWLNELDPTIKKGPWTEEEVRPQTYA